LEKSIEEKKQDKTLTIEPEPEEKHVDITP
jgi:hypothetical protein